MTSESAEVIPIKSPITVATENLTKVLMALPASPYASVSATWKRVDEQIITVTVSLSKDDDSDE